MITEAMLRGFVNVPFHEELVLGALNRTIGDEHKLFAIFLISTRNGTHILQRGSRYSARILQSQTIITPLIYHELLAIVHNTLHRFSLTQLEMNLTIIFQDNEIRIDRWLKQCWLQ